MSAWTILVSIAIFIMVVWLFFSLAAVFRPWFRERAGHEFPGFLRGVCVAFPFMAVATAFLIVINSCALIFGSLLWVWCRLRGRPMA